MGSFFGKPRDTVIVLESENDKLKKYFKANGADKFPSCEGY